MFRRDLWLSRISGEVIKADLKSQRGNIVLKTPSSDDTIELEIAEEDPLDGEEDVELIGEIPWEESYSEPLKVIFAGGKGGAGRSLLAANVAIFLSRLGREVVAVDLDPGGLNLHTYLGVEPLMPNNGVLLRGLTRRVTERVPGTNLRLCRPSRPLESGEDPLRLEVLQAAIDAGADLIIMDMGCQMDPFTLDEFLNAHLSVVVLLPQPAAVERGYAFLRTALYRRLLHGDDEPAVVARALLAADQVGQLQSPEDLISALSGVHRSAAEAIRARVMAFTPKILMNQCRTQADRDMERGIVSAVRGRWGLKAEALGGVDNDDAAFEATRRRRPLMVEYPGSTLSGEIERLARRILSLLGTQGRST